jgi:hypothetical protein
MEKRDKSSTRRGFQKLSSRRSDLGGRGRTHASPLMDRNPSGHIYQASMYEAAHTTCHVQNPQTPVRGVTTPSNLPVKATGREGRRITGYHIFPKRSSQNANQISEDANCAIREIILNFPRKRKLSTDCRALRTVYRAGAPRKRRWFDTASSPVCPSLAAASVQIPCPARAPRGA